jgi:hypothetical protein
VVNFSAPSGTITSSACVVYLVDATCLATLTIDKACAIVPAAGNVEAGKKRLAGDTARAATSDEVKELRREAGALKEVVGSAHEVIAALDQRAPHPQYMAIALRFMSLRLSA